MKISMAILMLSLALATHLRGQINQFSNPTVAPLHFNPAFAGSLDQNRLALAYRHQWVAIPGSFRTGYASYDQVSNRLHGAFGGEVYLEGYGDNNIDLRVSGIYAAKFNLGSNWTLSPALKAGYQSRKLKAVGFNSQGNPEGVYFTRQSVNLSPGILINSPAFYFGVSSEFLGSIRLQESVQDPLVENFRPIRNWKFQSGYRFQPKDRPWSLAATGVVTVYGPITEIIGQLIYSRKWLLAGVGFGSSGISNLGSISMTAGYKHRLFRAMLVYDYDIGLLSNSISGGSYEASLMFYLPRKKVSSSPESSALQ